MNKIISTGISITRNLFGFEFCFCLFNVEFWKCLNVRKNERLWKYLRIRRGFRFAIK